MFAIDGKSKTCDGRNDRHPAADYHDCMPRLSVIIPTHRRSVILKRCLDHLERQTTVKQIEVIVVSDGRDEETRRVVSDRRSAMSIPMTCIDVAPCHQGTARNRGVMEATGDHVLFIGDDIFLARDACEKHFATHERLADQTKLIAHRSPLIAVLGHTTWDPAVGITDTMRWLETSGWQFGYPMIERYAHGFVPARFQHRFTYTSHISLPRAVALAHPFREDVTLYGWEDIEWGLRLKNAGLKLFYEPDAKALHHHHMTLEDSLRRVETLGRSARVMEALNPALHVMPRGWKRMTYDILSLLPTIRGRHAQAFMRGVAHGER
ncbi:MAG: glycosyl transferase family 2 [Candidatus Peregrinibacteria bacterium Greene0416_19]|nr:MAG: glycosyl transferase family 2 [Candidatus Peregrinibacteria bacterium Greene0416_19]